MFDTHYDLLTIMYWCYLKNDFSYIEKLSNDLKDIRGLIANLYFMNKEEMKKELQLEDIDVFEMFKVSTNLCTEYFNNKKIIFSIEGCDYIKDEKELENLYNLGLRNILLVWNNKNKYGSGNKSNLGLTALGKSFVEKSVDLGISIDLSHMNENTFWDTIELLRELKEKGKEIKVLASHSNCYSICKNKRNLTDEQILAIKEFDGIISLVSYGPFINEKQENLEDNFIKHMKYLENLVGINNIAIATDNMDFAIDLFNIEEDISLLKHETVNNKLTKLLSDYYNNDEMEKILFKNIESFYNI